MRVTITGATGLIGSAMVAALRARGDEVTVLSRDPVRARRVLLDANAPRSLSPGAPPDPAQPGRAPDDLQLPARPQGELHAMRWDAGGQPAPVEALSGRHAVIHLAGENIAQRWTADAKARIRDSRVIGTRNLVAGIRACPEPERPRVLLSASAIGYYGPHGEEPLDEEAPVGIDFLSRTCLAWEAEAQAAERLGLRVVRLRTGVVLDPTGGALGKMLLPFKLGIGGPVAGGGQYISWIAVDDLVDIALTAIDDDRWQGPVNATAPDPRTNKDFSRALGRALGRPSLLPIPGLALRLLYGEMADIVTTGARVLPAKALVLGYRFRKPMLEQALQAAVGAL